MFIKKENQLYRDKMREREASRFDAIAAKMGWQKAGPSPTLAGKSGVMHSFDYLATDGQNLFAFDVYDQLGEVEVLKTGIKKIDTGVSTSIVCLSGNITEQARKLIADYKLKVFLGDELDDLEKIEKEFKSLTRT